MFLVFSKQFRDEEKIISALIKKIKKSKTIQQTVVGNKEKYSLDGFDICFETAEHKFVVTDKDNKTVVSMDCHYDAYDEMQEVRSNWFYELEDVARTRNKKALEAEAKQEKWERGTRAVSAATRAKQEQAKHNAALRTLQRIKGL